MQEIVFNFRFHFCLAFKESNSRLCLKDLGKEVTVELTSRLYSDKVVLNRFYRSFGLDPDLVQDDRDIGNLFPDTPVTLLKEVFEALQLYDFAEFLEKAAKPRTLRLALSPKEMEKLSNSNRPTKVYSKAEILTIEFCEGHQSDARNVERVASFFKALNSQNEITRLTSNFSKKLFQDLDSLVTLIKSEEESTDIGLWSREKHLELLLEQKLPESHVNKHPFEYDSSLSAPERFLAFAEQYARIRRQEQEMDPNADERLLSMFNKEEPAMRKRLKELTEERERWQNERKPIIERQIKQKQEELRKETEKLEIGVSTVIDKWVERHAHNKGKS